MIKNIIKKGEYTKQKVFIAVIFSLIVATIITCIPNTFIWDRIPIFAAIILCILLHFIFKLEVMYNFIYKYRYILSAGILIYIVIMEYSGSSIGCYNNNYQPQRSQIYDTPILGVHRAIRSDEWNVNTPLAISQGIGANKYSYYNDKLRGTTTDMFSIVGTPVLDIILLGKPFNIGYILFGVAKGVSFYWYGKIIALMLVSFEFFMVVTNKKKLLSMFGMILVLFSAATQWWNSTEVVMWGLLALVLFDKFMLSEKYKVKIACATGIFLCAVAYIFILYPAWQLSYAYVYVALLIWVLCKNWKKYKINWKDILIVVLVILAIAGVCFRYYSLSKDTLTAVMNTDYPGERFELGGLGKGILFSYVYSFFLPYQRGMQNPCEISGMTSLYPIPMIIAFIYLIRNKDRKKHFSFLIPLLVVSIAFSFWALTATNEIFAKLTLLYMVPSQRLAIPLGLIQIILLIYLMANIKKEDKIVNNNIAKIVAVILSVIILSIAIQTAPPEIMGNLRSFICGLLLLAQIYLVFTLNNENSKKWLMIILIPISIITGATVNPIQKGISVITEKPVSKKIQQIVENDSQNNMWLVDALPNYAVANGARVLNSVNSYPNFEFYEKLLKEDFEENRKIYNRYAHVMFTITNEESSVELLSQDSLLAKINPNSLKDLQVKYILMRSSLEEYSTQEVNFEEIYNEYGIYIYKINY